MALSYDFCWGVLDCDQYRGGSRAPQETCAICNLTHEPLSGMNLWDCPGVKKVLAEHRTIGRQDALAELDRSAGQPLRTYIEKQSLVNLLILAGCKYHEEKKDDHAAAINLILTTALAGNVLKEVEL